MFVCVNKDRFNRYCMQQSRGTQRQFSENICSEDDLRSRSFGKKCEFRIRCVEKQFGGEKNENNWKTIS